MLPESGRLPCCAERPQALIGIPVFGRHENQLPSMRLPPRSLSEPRGHVKGRCFQLDIPGAFEYYRAVADGPIRTGSLAPKGIFSDRAEIILQNGEESMSKEILAPMPGKVVEILVGEGDEVLEYQEVLVLEAMKMENPIPAPEAGKVRSINVKIDDKVATDQVLMVLE
jgi:biotin carboxyl carrier protein